MCVFTCIYFITTTLSDQKMFSGRLKLFLWCSFYLVYHLLDNKQLCVICGITVLVKPKSSELIKSFINYD